MKTNAKDYVSAAQQFFTAYDAHDVDGMLALCADGALGRYAPYGRGSVFSMMPRSIEASSAQRTNDANNEGGDYGLRRNQSARHNSRPRRNGVSSRSFRAVPIQPCHALMAVWGRAFRGRRTCTGRGAVGRCCGFA